MTKEFGFLDGLKLIKYRKKVQVVADISEAMSKYSLLVTVECKVV
jgi:hypothetical protein